MRSGFLIRAAVGTMLCGWRCLVAAPQADAQDTSTSPPSSTPHQAKKDSASSAKKTSKGKRSRKSKKRKRGQQAIDSPRAREIQEALIRQHYLDGDASGHWDAPTEDALRRYQADQGWQTKTVPDSRALIKLGLGPSTDGLLNPESAMTAPANADPRPNPSASSANENKPQP